MEIREIPAAKLLFPEHCEYLFVNEPERVIFIQTHKNAILLEAGAIPSVLARLIQIEGDVKPIIIALKKGVSLEQAQKLMVALGILDMSEAISSSDLEDLTEKNRINLN